MNPKIMVGAAWLSIAGVGTLTGQTPGENVMNVMQAKPAAAHFVRPAAFDFPALLPEPPAEGSPAEASELLVVRQVQAGRTPEQEQWAQQVEKDHIFNHAGVLGPWFAKENLPVTAAFFTKLGDDLKAIDGASKQPFRRKRPTTLDASLRPCVTVPKSTSYPSGSAMQSYVWAELLAEIFPGKRDELLARAERAAWGRVLGGVHFPSDLTGGKILAGAFLAEVKQNPQFLAELQACKTELVARGRP